MSKLRDITLAAGFGVLAYCAPSYAEETGTDIKIERGSEQENLKSRVLNSNSGSGLFDISILVGSDRKAKIQPPYTEIKQKPYCCVPACIQMILSRRGFPFIGQEEIGIDLGLRVPQDSLDDFENVVSGRQPLSGWGTQINLKKYSLNAFFKKRNIPLHSSYYSLRDINQVPGFITDNLTNGNDMLICFRYGALYHENVSYGHASLIEAINGDTITLVDPNTPKRKKVRTKSLVRAILLHKKGAKQLGGFWIVN